VSIPYHIAVLSEKGGVGKTTLAIHLAWMLAKQEEDVALVDADPQASVLAWYEERKGDAPFRILEHAKPTFHEDFWPSGDFTRSEYEDLAKKGLLDDFYVIDCPPRVTDIARSAILVADLIIIPITPSSLDVWAGQNTIELIEESKEYRDRSQEPPYCIVLNRVIVNTEISRKVDAALRNAGMPVMDTWIKQRVAYAECISAGKTIFETDPRGKAAIEMKQLWKDVWMFADRGLGYERP
jgi:chromosome partitioning protein